jgi:hypothetical protein
MQKPARSKGVWLCALLRAGFCIVFHQSEIALADKNFRDKHESREIK